MSTCSYFPLCPRILTLRQVHTFISLAEVGKPIYSVTSHSFSSQQLYTSYLPAFQFPASSVRFYSPLSLGILIPRYARRALLFPAKVTRTIGPITSHSYSPPCLLADCLSFLAFQFSASVVHSFSPPAAYANSLRISSHSNASLDSYVLIPRQGEPWLSHLHAF